MARQDFVHRDGWDSYILKGSVAEYDGKITIDSDPSGQNDFHDRPSGGHRIRVTFPTDVPLTISFSKHDDGKHARMGGKVVDGDTIVGKGKKPKKIQTDGDEDVVWVATKGGGTIFDKKTKPAKAARKKTKTSRKKASKK